MTPNFTFAPPNSIDPSWSQFIEKKLESLPEVLREQNRQFVTTQIAFGAAQAWISSAKEFLRPIDRGGFEELEKEAEALLNTGCHNGEEIARCIALHDQFKTAQIIHQIGKILDLVPGALRTIREDGTEDIVDSVARTMNEFLPIV